MSNQESTQRKIELNKDDPDALNVLIRHMYAFDYPPTIPASFELPRLVLGMRVAKIADFYDVQPLQRDAVGLFRSDAQALWGLQGFADAITEAYSTDGYECFRDILVMIAADQLANFKNSKDVYKSFWTAVDTYHEFASALLRVTPPVKSATPFALSAPFANKRLNESDNLPPPKRLSTAVATPGAYNPFAASVTPRTGSGSNHPTPPAQAVNVSTPAGPTPTRPPVHGWAGLSRGGGIPRCGGIPRGGAGGG